MPPSVLALCLASIFHWYVFHHVPYWFGSGAHRAHACGTHACANQWMVTFRGILESRKLILLFITFPALPLLRRLRLERSSNPKPLHLSAPKLESGRGGGGDGGEMTRRCSHCSHDGHNSRTCPNRGVKLFGVRLTEGSIRKSASMGNLSILAGCSGGVSPANGSEPGGSAASADGYASEDFTKGYASASCRERKKGNPWTEEEQIMFLLGLQKLGKGDWRVISRNYVVSRSPTQVASHAQKYFIRKANTTRRKRRSSLFDVEPDEVPFSLCVCHCNEQMFASVRFSFLRGKCL
ncbi:MYB family transcription factor [Musa troglodytarum]|uniref:MYB family transcription factor n=1 Tax=Musa troglodytarum TaxID=320322 RepID=A0A9E7JUY3_9LILI|nr:MYB family transcription factor [Musa troglodytarum]